MIKVVEVKRAQKRSRGIGGVDDICSAIHICTGQRATGRAVEAWLAEYGVETVRFDDVYEACAYLLKHYDRVPDLVLVGIDWLAPSEFNIVPYIRQTWPRVGMVVYGATTNAPLFDALPYVLTCSSAAALRSILGRSPNDLAGRLYGQHTAAVPVVVGAAHAQPAVVPHAPAAPTTPAPLPATRTVEREGTAAATPVIEREAAREETAEAAAQRPVTKSQMDIPQAPPRAILTAEELSALLDNSGDA